MHRTREARAAHEVEVGKLQAQLAEAHGGEEKRQKDVNAQICYHKMEDHPSEPGAFKLVTETAVVFACGEEEKKDAKPDTDKKVDNEKVTQFNFGAKATDFAVWDSHVTKIVWAVRWGIKGLQPIKPCIALTKLVPLATGRALVISE